MTVATFIKSVTSVVGLTVKFDLRAVLGNSLWRPSPPSFLESNDHEKFTMESFQDTKNRILLASDWLVSWQAFQPDGGVTGWILLHSLYKKSGSYPEVTGYIIPTLLKCSHIFMDQNLIDSAIRMADFELGIQMEDGAFQGDVIGCGPVKKSVFNTAQIMHGLLHAYQATKAEKYLNAASAAAGWILTVQDDDGSWSENNYLGLKRVYDAKVAEVLLELFHLTGSENYRRAAERNLDFVVSRQTANGWFADCDNSADRNHEPLTHTIGYTVQGLLESGRMLGEEKFLSAARKTLDRLLRIFELRKDLLAGRYDTDWKPTVKSSCVTGCAQISVCWQRLHEITGEMIYLNAALKMNDLLKSIQFTKGSAEVRGALPASYPIWGDYGPWVINSWGIKYFIDALLLEYEFKEQHIERL